MRRARRLYALVQADARGSPARALRSLHQAMVALGVAIMLAQSVAPWWKAHAVLLGIGFFLVAAFFTAEYALRLFLASEAPGGEHRPAWRSRLSWAFSLGGLFDLAGALPGFIGVALGPRQASLFGFIWGFKLVRYCPGLVSLERVISHAKNELIGVLLGFGIALLTAASLAYLLEHQAEPKVFGSIPAAMWWAIETMSTVGYGDAIPQTVFGRMLASLVMMSGIVVFALWAGILATGYADEMRRRAFLRTWDLVAKVPFFQSAGAAAIAEVARLLRPREYQAGATIMRRGEPGESMYFIVSGEVQIRLRPQSVRMTAGEFFGEIALLTGSARSATVVALTPTTLLVLDIVHFRELLGRQPELARIIREEALRRLDETAAAVARSETAAVEGRR
jgi:voltage-gated potassium channel